MLLVSHASERQKFAAIFDQMYALRARQFSQRRGWRVVAEYGMKKDVFDEMNPLYICIVLDDGKTKIAFPALLSDLGHLDTKQLKTLGLGIEALYPYKVYHTRRFSELPYYSRLKNKLEAKFERDIRQYAR